MEQLSAKRAIIVAGGQTSSAESSQYWLQDGDLIIGADGGAAQALAWGLLPDIVIGDMDSLPSEEREHLVRMGCCFVEHPRAKDETDLELALVYAANEGVQEIIVLGALGGRLDHTLSNVLLLSLPVLATITVYIIFGEERSLLIQGGQSKILEGQPGDLVSLLPLGGDVLGVTTEGLTWGLEEETLLFGFSRGISNVMVGTTARIQVQAGYLLVVHQPEPDN